MHARPNMKKFIQRISGLAVWIDITKIVAMERGEGYDFTAVYLTGSRAFDIKETPEEIFDPARE